MDSFAQRIRSLRGMKTQDDFAQELGIHKNTLGRWERGQAEPDVSTAQHICATFGVSPYWLLAGQGPMLEKDRNIRLIAGPETKAGDMGEYKPAEVSGGPQFDATMAQVQARLLKLERERDEAREAELRAKDEALKAKDEALEAMRALAFKGQGGRPDNDAEPPTSMAQYGLPSRPQRRK